MESIGIGSPGCIDNEQGEVVFVNNLNWKHVPVRKSYKDILTYLYILRMMPMLQDWQKL